MQNTKILLVENTPLIIKDLALALEPEGYDLSVSTDLIQASRLLSEESYDLVLIDQNAIPHDLPDLCEVIHSHEVNAHIPIMILRSTDESDNLQLMLNLDADDHMSKNFNHAELRRRIHNLLDLKHTRETLGQVREELQLTQIHLSDVMNQLEHVSRTDLLTGLSNRKHAIEKIEEESARFARSKRFFALMICDIDQFHTVNDECGTEVGDFVLRALSSYFRNAVRRQDMVSRWGGEEFLFILPETDALGAKILAEKIRMRLENFALSYGQHRLHVTCSFGITSYQLEQTPTQNLKRLDEALLLSKAKGGNMVIEAKPQRV